MTQDPKTVFEFDPLPGEQVPAAETMTPGEPKKRGRKPKEPKVTKPERKKRGPRRVQAQSNVLLQDPIIAVQVPAVEQPKKTRKPRRAKADPPELFFIQRMMHLSEKKRKHILDVLNKIFA